MRRTEARRACVLKPAELSMVLERAEGKTDILVNGAEIRRPAKKRGEVIAENKGLDISPPNHIRKKNWIKLG